MTTPWHNTQPSRPGIYWFRHPNGSVQLLRAIVSSYAMLYQNLLDPRPVWFCLTEEGVENPAGWWAEAMPPNYVQASEPVYVGKYQPPELLPVDQLPGSDTNTFDLPMPPVQVYANTRVFNLHADGMDDDHG